MSGNAESETHRMRTREKNAGVHPGEKYKEASRSRQPPRPREVIQKEKNEKAASQQARAKAKALKVAGEERATQLEQEKRAMLALEDKHIPRRLPAKKRGMWRNGSSLFTTNALQGKQLQGADANTYKAPELMKKRKDIQSANEDTRQGNTSKKIKISHKARKESPVRQAKCPHSPTVLVSEKTNLSIENPNALTRNWC